MGQLLVLGPNGNSHHNVIAVVFRWKSVGIALWYSNSECWASHLAYNIEQFNADMTSLCQTHSTSTTNHKPAL